MKANENIVISLGTVGHIDHGKTTLSATIVNVLNDTKNDAKTIHEIIEENKSIKITAPPQIPLIQWNFKSGKEERRERRKKQRKSN
jgi:translation initiation factor 2 gamma subunit (eIF-2gamma)